ncbi:MAG: EF-P lysine aminoacylase GenX [Proteobacteria bacterium]|nr:EF-P lysine aminoacylase GenX [Pseudomonadota bacterium]MBU1647901.1 EF-P lysine aminoacylase GenX [Pseudomonadota bacterium]MBU1986504.1 EF-P lysine aminoacylase GenX [Pseudomonadota bacterium]
MLDIQGLCFRAAFFHSLRSFFVRQQFLEVDTPIRQPLLLPEFNIEPLASECWFLQASPELCMKRMLAAGCSRIFQLCNCFRKGERGRLHLEEFTMLEWYRTNAGYEDLMADCEALLGSLLADLGGMDFCGFSDGNLRAGERFISLQPPWERLSVHEAFARCSPVSIEQAMADDTFDEILVEYVEPYLGVERPLFLYDYPVELGSLARRKDGSPHLAERFELYINGIEMANGFSELTDSQEQRQRFERELELMDEERRRRSLMPERFLEELAGLDRAAGIALGVDRLLMLLMGKESVGEVVSFGPSDFD